MRQLIPRLARKPKNTPVYVAERKKKSSSHEKKVKAKAKAKSKAKREAKRNLEEQQTTQSLQATKDLLEIEDQEGNFISFTDDKENQKSNNENNENIATGDTNESDTFELMRNVRMPWMIECDGYYHPNVYVNLHNEIMHFVTFISPTKEEIIAREDLVSLIKSITSLLWKDSKLYTFGSHATQMFLPKSDIDMVLFGVPTGTQPLFDLKERLEHMDLVSYIEVVDKARIPIVKFVHKTTKLQVDVSFNVDGGLATADLVKHYTRLYPAFRPLTLVLKYYLAQRDLNETYSGGIGSFMLQLMVVSFLQHHRRGLKSNYDNPTYNDLGHLLVGFFNLYGRDWNYNDLGISVQNGGSYYYKEDKDWYDEHQTYYLSVENPMQPELEIGKNSYEIRTIRRSFEFARQVLNSEIRHRGQVDPFPGSILGAIIPGDSVLLSREPPKSFGFDILYHDPSKTEEIRQQYEMRKAASEEERLNDARKKAKARKKQSKSDNPKDRWKGKRYIEF